MKKKLKLLLVKDDKEHFSHIYRRILPLHFMSQAGLIEYKEVRTIDRDKDGKAVVDKNVNWADIILFHMAQGAVTKNADGKEFRTSTADLVKELQKLGKVVSFDCDDLYYDLPKDGVKFPKWVIEDTKAVAKQVDGVTVCSPFLGEMQTKFADVPKERITYIPNMVLVSEWNECYNKPTNKIRRDLNKKDGVVKVGMMGTNNHFKNFCQNIPICQLLKKKYGDKIQFEVFGLNEEYLKTVEKYTAHKNYIPYAKQAYKEMLELGFVFKAPALNGENFPNEMCLLGWDIGIVMIDNNRTDKSKSFLKWMDYSLARIATVARGISPYTDVIVDGHNGMLANGITEYVNKISHLIDNLPMRQLLINNSIKEIGTSFNIETGYIVWYNYFKSLFDNRTRTILSEHYKRILEKRSVGIK